MATSHGLWAFPADDLEAASVVIRIASTSQKLFCNMSHLALYDQVIRGLDEVVN